MMIKLKFYVFFYLILFTQSHVSSQPFTNIPGFKPFDLPKATQYLKRTRMSVNSFGVGYPTSDNFTVVFADNIKFEHFHMFRNGGAAKHLMIIANTITIGNDNTVVSQSDNRNGDDPDGGSLIIICRKLRFDVNSSIFFLGTAINMQGFKTGTQPPVYSGSYGSQLLIAAEKIEVSPELRRRVINHHLAAHDKYISYLIEDENRKKVIIDNLLRPPLITSGIVVDFLGDDKVSEYLNILNSQQTDNRKVIEIAHQLRSLYYKDDHGLYDLIRYDITRSWRSAFLNAQTPFSNVFPYGEPFYYPKEGYYGIGGAVPIVVSSGFCDPLFINGVLQPEYRQLEYTTFPSSVEVVAAMINKDALRVLSADHQELFSQWAVEWIKFKKSLAERLNQNGDRVGFFNAIREIFEMPRYELDAPYNDQYDAIYNQAVALLSEAQTLVSVKQLILDAPLAGKPANVFAQGIPFKYYLPPTEILLNSIHQTNDWFYGLVEEINSPERLKRLTFQGELKTDPLITKAVIDKLSASENVTLQQGLLSNVRYEIAGDLGDGIRKFTALLEGNAVNITLDIEPDAVAKVMLRFTNSGLSYHLKWNVPGNPVQQGEFDQPLYLRLSRRTGGRIEVRGMQITNNETKGAVKIVYVRTSKGRVIPITETIVEAGKTVTLSGIPLEQNEQLSDVPDMGITYDDGSFQTSIGRFLELPGGSVVDKIIVSNKIPATISPAGSELIYQVYNVEIDLALVDPDTQVARIFEHKALSPDGSDGAITRAQTERLLGLSNRYRITGKVNLKDGGTIELKPTDFTSPVINLTVDQLKQ